MTSQQRPISDLVAQGRPLLSLEFFPPKTDATAAALAGSLAELEAFEPDFVSVTYGAGGTTREGTARLCELLERAHGFTVMPHLTCVGATREELAETVDGIHARGYRNIMALRGDAPRDQDFEPTRGGFRYAADLVALIRERHPDIAIGVAGYPEKHPQAPSSEEDLRHLKEKVDAGAAFVTTQLFFENEAFLRFVERARAIGIQVPIFPGLMPVLAVAQIKRIVQLCGSNLPKRLEAALDAVSEDPAAVAELGFAWARDQLVGLLEAGAPGVHLYVLNRADVAVRLMRAFRETEDGL